MGKHTVTFTAKELPLLLQAFALINGPKDLMLSYKFGLAQEPLAKLRATLVEKLTLLDALDENGAVRPSLDDEVREAVAAVLAEEIEIEIPEITLREVAMNRLTVNDDSVMPYLVDRGFIVAD